MRGIVGTIALESATLAAHATTVVTCADDPANLSLRVVAEIGAASDGIVDLSQLPTLCGTVDATITLEHGEIPITRGDLVIQGPAPGTGTVTIGANSASRIFNHTGTGTLSLNNVTVMNGQYSAGSTPSPTLVEGGCIKSAGNVVLNHSAVLFCGLQNRLTSNALRGGAIYSGGTTTLLSSKVTNSSARNYVGIGGAAGGGVYAAGGLAMQYSVIASNSAYAIDSRAYGGGVTAVGGSTLISASTINNNRTAGPGDTGAGAGGALFISHAAAFVTNSTIYKNTSGGGGAVSIAYSQGLISYSTIAANHAVAGSGGIATRSGELNLISSIVARNTSGSGNAASDLSNSAAMPTALSGAHNLIVSANVPLNGIASVQTDPRLLPFSFNGGPTATLALMAGSPAIGMGALGDTLPFDQRGPGYPRRSGATTDIGAVQYEAIFFDGFQPGP